MPTTRPPIRPHRERTTSLNKQDCQNLAHEFDQLYQELEQMRSCNQRSGVADQPMVPPPPPTTQLAVPQMSRQKSSSSQSSSAAHVQNYQEQYLKYQQMNASRARTGSVGSTASSVASSAMSGAPMKPALKPTLQTTNMYAMEQYALLQQHQQHSPTTMTPNSDGTSSKRPSVDTQGSRLSQMDVPSLGLHSNPPSPEYVVQKYPSTMSSLASILMLSKVTHGSLQRSETVATPVGSTTGGATELKKKSIFSLFKMNKGKPAPGPPAASALDSTSTKLSPCAIAVFRNRVYVYDQTKSYHKQVPGPVVTSGATGSETGQLRRRGTTGSSSTSLLNKTYSSNLMEQYPRIVLELKSVCVAEEGLWVLQLTGADLIRGGVACEMYLQASDVDEMVKWLQVFRSSAL
ncbi:hypothetical protein HDU98_011864 [Podochytrium sp. JEL0797]|nr:hypothetical protein HDU98_011864 [Podochytrium sp. JEL0797]